MAIIVKAKSDRVLVPEGVHPAICIGVYDIGTHPSPQYGKESRSVVIQWELPDEKTHDGKPMTTSRKYGMSLSEKSALRADLQGWRGRAFSEQEAEGFDITVLLGKPCQLQVLHETKGDRTYDNVKAVIKAAKGYAAPKPFHPLLSFSFDDDPPNKLTSEFPQWIQDKIMAAKEWAGLSSVGAGGQGEAGQDDWGSAGGADDDIPY